MSTGTENEKLRLNIGIAIFLLSLFFFIADHCKYDPLLS